MSFLTKTCLAIALTATPSLVTSCVATQVGVSAAVSSPRLVWIGPGVWVVEDQPWPVYYRDGFYWTYRDGFWYRSDYYSDGFVRVGFRAVPVPVVRVHRPRVYVRYHAPSGARVRVIDRRSDRSRTRPTDRPRTRPADRSRDRRR